MILSDRSINEAIASGRLEIDPFDPALVQPASVDVRLDSRVLVFRNTKRAFIDIKQPADDLMEMIEFGPNEPILLHPHEFVLGSTVERVKMPDDLVARLEGRSSLGRLGVVIHSSLPYESPVLFLDEHGVLDFQPVGQLVENRIRGRVLGFDRDTFDVGFHEVTNWFKELPDKIYEVRLASGRRVQVTAGHNLFTVNSAGELVKTPTLALCRGTRVAIPKSIPDPSAAVPEYRLLDLLPEDVLDELVCQGPTVDLILRLREPDVRAHLRAAGLSVSYYFRTRKLPLPILRQLCSVPLCLEPEDCLSYRGGGSLPAVIRVDRELAWLLGLYVAECDRRDKRVTIAHTDQAILGRAEAALTTLGQRTYRNSAGITCCSVLMSALFEALGITEGAPSKRLPTGALGWPRRLLESLFGGLIDGRGSIGLWTTSASLLSNADALVLSARLGKRAVTQVPDPTHLVSLSTLEKDRNRAAVHVSTLERGHDAYSRLVPTVSSTFGKLNRLVNGDLLWDEVVEVVDTGRFETVYDLEVRSLAANVENFLAGHGGIFVSNTAGFVDPSFEGHVTLEISNLANLPIALYPGMRIGQLSFSQMTTAADRPYGPSRGSKYSGQSLPTASRLYLDFK